MNCKKLLLVGVCTWAIGLSAVVAQDDFSIRRYQPSPGQPPAKLQDPTEASQRLREALTIHLGPGTMPVTIPMPMIRARMIAADQQSAALLEISGRVFMVRPGNEINFAVQGQANPLTMVVSSISAADVQLVVKATRQTVVVR